MPTRPPTSEIQITFNGRKKRLKKNYSVTEWLLREKRRPERVAVELNGVLLQKSEYATQTLRSKDVLEVVYHLGGAA